MEEEEELGFVGDPDLEPYDLAELFNWWWWIDDEDKGGFVLL